MPLGPMNTKAQKREGMHQVMSEFKSGALHSGSKTGPVVKNRKQAIAIAMHQTGQSKYAAGGSVPWVERMAFNRMPKSGFIHSVIPGRTDKHSINVAAGSYVLPADHVSALGQNNSLAGAAKIKNMFGPGGKFGPRLKMPKFASGGGVEPVPIIAAGGEHILPPEIVRRIGGGDIKKGHDILDKWVLAVRKKHIKKLRTLSPPKK